MLVVENLHRPFGCDVRLPINSGSRHLAHLARKELLHLFWNAYHARFLCLWVYKTSIRPVRSPWPETSPAVSNHPSTKAHLPPSDWVVVRFRECQNTTGLWKGLVEVRGQANLLPASPFFHIESQAGPAAEMGP